MPLLVVMFALYLENTYEVATLDIWHCSNGILKVTNQ